VKLMCGSLMNIFKLSSRDRREMGSCNFLPGLALNHDPPNLTSQVAKITGMGTVPGGQGIFKTQGCVYTPCTKVIGHLQVSF
jgi:hypothetical protein